MENDFQGLDGQTLPHMPEDFVNSVSERYIELYEMITGEAFIKADVADIEGRINKNVLAALA